MPARPLRILSTPFKRIPRSINQKNDAADTCTPVMTSKPSDKEPRELLQKPPTAPRLLSGPSNSNSRQFVITHIRANDIAIDLERIPVGFYVLVEAEEIQWRTRHKPILVHERAMVWDDEIVLPLGLCSDIRIRVCASFEFSPILGNGETLRTFVIDNGELPEHSGTMKSIEFRPPEGEQIFPCSLLFITVEQRNCAFSAPTPVSDRRNHTHGLDDSSTLALITDEGHNSLSRYYKDEEPEDLRHSIACFERAVQACLLTHPCRAVVLFNLATARLISCQVGITSPDFDVSITLYQDALDLRPAGHPDRPATLLHLARATMSRFLKWGGDSYVEEAKKLIAQVQDICSVDSYEHQLADRMLQECGLDEVTNEHDTVLNPMDSAVSIPELEDVTLNVADHDPRKPAMLDALAVSLLSRFEKLGQIADIDESIKAIEKALELSQECHPAWLQRTLCHAVLLGRRFRQSQSEDDLERSISVLKEVVQRAPDGHPDRPLALVNFGISVFARFGIFGQMEDINKSISAQEEALELTPNGHPDRFSFLTHLGVAFFKRSERLNDPTDLDKSISLMEEATRCASRNQVGVASPMSLPEPPSDAGASPIFTRIDTLRILLDRHVLAHRILIHLGHAFQLRFVHYGDPADLDRSISVREEVLRVIPRSDRARPSCLASLGYAFLVRCQRLGNLSDLHNSTSVLAEAVRLTPNDHPERPERLIEYGASLTKRFERLGNIVDIDQAIAVEEEAVQRTDCRHPRSSWLGILGASFLRRFERLGNITDLEKSISMMEEVIQLTLVDDPDRPRRLAFLGVAFRLRFGRLGDLSDLNKSILMLEESTQLVPDSNPVKRSALTALAYATQVRSEHLGSMADQDRSIFVAENAVQLTPVDDPGFPTTLSTVGALLSRRFLRRGNVADLDRSTSFLERALHLVPDDHPDRLPILISAGTSLAYRFNALGSLPALQSAISYFSCAARSRGSGRPSVQFQAFNFWAECIIILHRGSNRHAYEALFEAFECALDLFPQLAWIGLPFRERYTKLLDAANITRSAVSVAVILGHIARAVEWLEQGRCVVWGQLLQLRTPLDELRHAYPDLANQIEWLSNALGRSSTAHDESLSRIGDGNDPEDSLEQRARRHRELVTKRENLLKQIQALPGFERFMLPKTFVQLRTCARLGPVVLLNVNQIYGSALIVAADLDEPIHVPLLGINDMQAQHLRTLLNKLLSNDGRVISRDEAFRAARPAAKDGQDFSYILSELWMKVVVPVLHALALSTPGRPTRVFWCPTGPLSFLPIHAAGNYDVTGPGNKTSDFIISSYIPTLSVLASSHDRAVTPNNIRLLTVLQPSSDGQTHLSGARDEIECIKGTIGGLSSARVQIHESNGDVEGVMNGMEQSEWIHFACHGVQDADDPTESGVCLANQRRLRLSDIIRLSRPRGGLAFLSACQTATGAVELSEEVVHLSAGMLFAGYSGVIGTMWSIRDSVAPRLAQDVYKQLFRDGKAPDSREAAWALHNAAESLRQSGEPFVAWVPFVHMGI